MITIDIKKREAKENPSKLRDQGFLPAVFYGKKVSATPISISAVDFMKAWKEAGESSVVTLKGVSEGDLEALIQDVSVDPVTEAPIHADFYVFEKGRKIEVSVTLNFVGVSPAVKELGGVLVKVMHEIDVEAMPSDLPSEIDVDISSLADFEGHILAKDISLPAGVSLVTDPEDVIASVSEPKEEEEEPQAEIDLSAIEVEKKGKAEEEEGSDGEEKKEN